MRWQTRRTLHKHRVDVHIYAHPAPAKTTCMHVRLVARLGTFSFKFFSSHHVPSRVARLFFHFLATNTNFSDTNDNVYHYAAEPK
jgi:hypothetical protein